MLIKRELQKIWRNRLFLYMLMALSLFNVLLVLLSPATLLRSGTGTSGQYKLLESELNGLTAAEKGDLISSHHDVILNILRIDSIERAIALDESAAGSRGMRRQNAALYDSCYARYEAKDYLIFQKIYMTNTGLSTKCILNIKKFQPIRDTWKV